jgi:2-methylaconitate cis-trans-isomerase PrpF
MPFHELADPALTLRLENIRGQFAEYLGLIHDRHAVDTSLLVNPFLILVAPPCSYPNYLNKTEVGEERVDIVCRLLYNAVWHQAYPVSGTIATGAASRIRGSIPYEILRPSTHSQPKVRIGHPAGVIDVTVAASNADNIWTLREAWVGRTARILMDGWAFLPPC